MQKYNQLLNDVWNSYKLSKKKEAGQFIDWRSESITLFFFNFAHRSFLQLEGQGMHALFERHNTLFSSTTDCLITVPITLISPLTHSAGYHVHKTFNVTRNGNQSLSVTKLQDMRTPHTTQHAMKQSITIIQWSISLTDDTMFGEIAHQHVELYMNGADRDACDTTSIVLKWQNIHEQDYSENPHWTHVSLIKTSCADISTPLHTFREWRETKCIECFQIKVLY